MIMKERLWMANPMDNHGVSPTFYCSVITINYLVVITNGSFTPSESERDVACGHVQHLNESKSNITFTWCEQSIKFENSS